MAVNLTKISLVDTWSVVGEKSDRYREIYLQQSLGRCALEETDLGNGARRIVIHWNSVEDKQAAGDAFLRVFLEERRLERGGRSLFISEEIASWNRIE